MPEVDFIYDDIKPTLLSTFTNSNIADFICHEACKEYYKVFKKKWIPSTYFAFEFDEYKKYSFLANDDIRGFFKMYKKEDVYALIENYFNCNLCVLSKKRERENHILYSITHTDYLEVSFADKSIYGNNNRPLYNALSNIAKHINNSDELLTRKELYEKYLMKDYIVKNLKLNKAQSKAMESFKGQANDSASNSQPAQASKEKIMLVGDATDLPDQKGKVVKMFFPRLSLPSAYPTSQEKSTVNTAHVAKKFLRIDDQVTLINKHKFNAVKYSRGFIDKRKAAQKPARKKFNFDF